MKTREIVAMATQKETKVTGIAAVEIPGETIR